MKLRRFTKTTFTMVLFAAILITGFLVVTPAAFASVYNYNINYAVQTAPDEISVQMQARYCDGCNPNPANNPGCPAFHTGGGHSDGTFAAVRLKDSNGTILDMQKLVINPTNWPNNVLHLQDFIFSGLSLDPGDVITVEGDLYCSWCGHWYPTPVNVSVQASNTQVTYTGAVSAQVGTSANVSAVLEDNTGAPLVGKTITFTLDGLPPVSAVTNASGIATTTLPIPASMAGGVYSMDTRFAGDASDLPSSDQDDFTVTAEQQPVWYIYASKQLDTGNDWTCDENFGSVVQTAYNLASTVITYEDTDSDGKNDKATITVQNAFATYYNSVTLDVKNIGTIPIKISDIEIINSDGSIRTMLLEGANSTILPGRRRGIGIDFRILDTVPPGTYSFTVSL